MRRMFFLLILAVLGGLLTLGSVMSDALLVDATPTFAAQAPEPIPFEEAAADELTADGQPIFIDCNYPGDCDPSGPEIIRCRTNASVAVAELIDGAVFASVQPVPNAGGEIPCFGFLDGIGEVDDIEVELLVDDERIEAFRTDFDDGVEGRIDIEPSEIDEILGGVSEVTVTLIDEDGMRLVFIFDGFVVLDAEDS